MGSLAETAVDVIVIGGGPAGLATAIAAQRRGLRVRVLERRMPPIDKVCGEGLMPDGLAELAELGVRLEGCGVGLRGIRYLDGPRRAQASFPEGPGRGVRRTDLHQALLDRARVLGVDLQFGVRAEPIETGATSVRVLCFGAPRPERDGDAMAARFLVGADGLHSKVRRWAGLSVPAGRRRPGRAERFGVRRHYRLKPWSDHVEVYWSDGCEAYVTPVGPECVGLALLWWQRRGDDPPGRPVFDALVARHPELGQRLQGAPVLSSDRGAGPLSQPVHRAGRGRVLLVGDASGYLDAITGEGLSLAFLQARLAAESMAADRPSSYPAAVRKVRRTADVLTRLVLLLSRAPTLRHRALRALEESPLLFERLLAVHVRSAPVRELGLVPTVQLLRRLALG